MTAQVNNESEISFEPMFNVLHQFCEVFKQLNSFLGIAFSDIKDKVEIISTNNKRFPNHKGLISFTQMEMKSNIHIFNGENNKKKKAPQEYKDYNSTARNLLRIMWLLTFIKYTFETTYHKPLEKMSTIYGEAYDEAFG